MLVHRRFQICIALACIGAAASCVTDGDELELDAIDQTIVGPIGTPPAAIVDISRGPVFTIDALAFRVRPHLAIGPFVRATPGLGDAISFRVPGTAARNVLFHNEADAMPGIAVYNLNVPAGGSDNMDNRSAAALVGQTLECWNSGAVNNVASRRAVLITVTGSLSGNPEILTAANVVPNEFLQATDAGAPCISTVNPSALTAVFRTIERDRTLTLYRAAGLRFWIDGLIHLAQLRTRTAALVEGPFSISTDPGVTGAARMCFDLPFGDPRAGTGVQQYPCHFGLNQLFFVDHTASNGTTPRLVSALSGRCLGIAVGDTSLGRRLQAFDCQDADNQKFALRNNRNNGAIEPVSGQSADRCVAVAGGPSSLPASVEQADCQHNNFALQELWTFDRRALPR